MSSILLAATNTFGPVIPRNGLQLHLDPNNSTSYPGTGNTWYDISGNNRDFTLTNRDFRNSGGIKWFDTWGMEIDGPASNSFGINNNSGFTIIVVCRPKRDAEGGGTHGSYAFNFHTNNGPGYGRGIQTHLPWTDSEGPWAVFDIGGDYSGADHRLYFNMDSYINSWTMFTFRSTAGNSTSTALRTIYANLTSKDSTTTPDADLDLTSTGMKIAYGYKSSGLAGSTWNARLGSFLVYNRSVSDAELTQIYNNLKPTYGLP